MRKIFLAATVLLLMAATATTATAQNSRSRAAIPQGKDFEAAKSKFDEFYFYLNALYVDTLDNARLVDDAIKKVLSDLDPHSSYSSAEEMKSISESFEGSFSGIGVEFDVLRDTLLVVNTIRGGPAESLGVIPNDRIIAIDGQSVIGISRTDVPKKLRGPKGTIVDIEVSRHGLPGTLGFRITRDNIPIHTVDAAYMPETGVGYIRVNRFAETTMQEFREAFYGFGNVNALILDLRGNGGGLMEQAIMMSEFFLPAGRTIVSMEGRATPERKYTSRRNGTFLDGPLVVLMDAVSASGSEIVAGAIQDWDRGLIIGQPSFGKGLVQQQIPLSDGSAVRITTSRYHTPTGRVIQRPYDKGKAEEYYIDHLRRAYDASYADSVNVDAPVYKTLVSGRTVLGGGGINPDIYVPLDTTKNYSYWNRLTRAGVINQYMNTYLETERAGLQARFPTFESFEKGYEITPGMIAGIAEMGRAQGIEYDAEKAKESMPDMNLHIKALVAQKLWDTTEYFRVINPADEEFAKAMEVIRNWNEYRKMLE